MKTLRKTSILYFDDETTCLDVFKQMFGDEYEVCAVSTLSEARAALSKERFDIVISDQLMPEIDGLAFLLEVSCAYPESFRMLLTGSLSLGEVIREVSAGIIHLFITKPWVEMSMRQALERADMPKTNLNSKLHGSNTDQVNRNAA